MHDGEHEFEKRIAPLAIAPGFELPDEVTAILRDQGREMRSDAKPAIAMAAVAAIDPALRPAIDGDIERESRARRRQAETGRQFPLIWSGLALIIVLPILWLKERKAPRPQAVLGAVAAVVGTAVIALL